MKIKSKIKKILINPEKEKEKARFKYKRNVTESLIILEETINALDYYNIDYYLDFGTLIGAMRDKGFIEWDDDMDISLFNLKDKALLPKVRNLIMTKSKLKVTRATFERSIRNRIRRAKRDKTIKVHVKKITFAKAANLRIMKIRNFKYKFLNIRKGIGRNCLDIFIKYPNEDKKTYWMAQNKIHSVDTAIIGTKLIEIDFYHLKCKVPANYDEYLTSMYGDWKKPKEDWQYYEHDSCSGVGLGKNTEIPKENEALTPITREVIIPAKSLSEKITLSKDSLQEIPFIEKNKIKSIEALISSTDNPDVEIDSKACIVTTTIVNSTTKVSLLKRTTKEDINREYNYTLNIPNAINEDIIVTLHLQDTLEDENSEVYLTKTVTIAAKNRTTIFTLTDEEEKFISKYNKFKLSIISIESKDKNVTINHLYSSVARIKVAKQKIALIENPINTENQFTYTLYLNKTMRRDISVIVNIDDTLSKVIIIPKGNMSRVFTLTQKEASYLKQSKNTVHADYVDNFTFEVWMHHAITLEKLPKDFFYEKEEPELPLTITFNEIPTFVNSNIYEYSFQLNRKSESDTIILLEIGIVEEEDSLIKKQVIIPSGNERENFSLDLDEINIPLKDHTFLVHIADIQNNSEKSIDTNLTTIPTNTKEKAMISVSQDNEIWEESSHKSYVVQLNRPSLEETKVYLTIGSLE